MIPQFIIMIVGIILLIVGGISFNTYTIPIAQATLASGNGNIACSNNGTTDGPCDVQVNFKGGYKSGINNGILKTKTRPISTEATFYNLLADSNCKDADHQILIYASDFGTGPGIIGNNSNTTGIILVVFGIFFFVVGSAWYYKVDVAK